MGLLNTKLLSQEILQAFANILPEMIEIDMYILTPELMLIALVNSEKTMARELLTKACHHRNKDLTALIFFLMEQPISEGDVNGDLIVHINDNPIPISRTAIIMLDKALSFAKSQGDEFINSKHLLLTLILGVSSIRSLLNNQGISNQLLEFLEIQSKETPLINTDKSDDRKPQVYPISEHQVQKLPSDSIKPLTNRVQQTSILGKAFTHKQFRCDVFMVMPFQEHLESIYQDHIKKIVSDLNLDIKRGDDPFSNHDIITEIWSLINNCQLVIADCTGKNPNVFYEMGLAHAIGKPVIPITQNEEDIPFDIRQRRFIKYDYTPRGMQEFEGNLKRAIQSVLDI